MAALQGADARYPIGPFDAKLPFTVRDRERAISVLAGAATALEAAISGLDDAQLDTPYRAGGWSVRQVVHHLPDSHLNSYLRFKLALTEDAPIIKPYFEDRWAELPDVQLTPPEVSLELLGALHSRWVTLLEALPETAYARTFVHPEGGVQTLGEALAYYAWHSQHHTAQITALQQRLGWRQKLTC